MRRSTTSKDHQNLHKQSIRVHRVEDEEGDGQNDEKMMPGRDQSIRVHREEDEEGDGQNEGKMMSGGDQVLERL
ncbi:hypothetical protein RRG08_052396 [Elysia crispata]|uniref:Uncharacterized protein n=1 Tax=Elysia crispata TaxID=231223 RepID=A0AAE1B2Q6_9GAST|nr:hypothetical protein RRG08_052396 [Elysia crispata]